MSTELDPSKSYTGTCQGCAAVQATTADRLLVHHGYKRPGIGSIVGDCIGVGKPAYELSCETTKVWLGHQKERVARLTARLDDLQNGRVQELHVTTKETTGYRSGNKRPEGEGWLETTKRGWGVVGYYRYHSFDVRPGHVPSKARAELEASTRWDGGVNPGHNWTYYLMREIERVTADLEETKADVAVLTKRVANWVYAPEKMTAYSERKNGPKLHWPRIVNGKQQHRALCQGVSRRLRQSDSAFATTKEEITCSRCQKAAGVKADAKV